MTDRDDIEAELDRIEAMSDEELLAEAHANGVDPIAEAERVKALLLDACKRTREAKARLMADPEPYFAVVFAALDWRTCDTSQSADRGIKCGCLDRLADAVDELLKVSGSAVQP